MISEIPRNPRCFVKIHDQQQQQENQNFSGQLNSFQQYQLQQQQQQQQTSALKPQGSRFNQQQQQVSSSGASAAPKVRITGTRHASPFLISCVVAVHLIPRLTQQQGFSYYRQPRSWSANVLNQSLAQLPNGRSTSPQPPPPSSPPLPPPPPPPPASHTLEHYRQHEGQGYYPGTAGSNQQQRHGHNNSSSRARSSPMASSSSGANLIPTSSYRESPLHSRREQASAGTCLNHHRNIQVHLVNERSAQAGYTPSPQIRRSLTTRNMDQQLLHQQTQQQTHDSGAGKETDEDQEPHSMMSMQSAVCSGYQQRSPPQPQARISNQHQEKGVRSGGGNHQMQAMHDHQSQVRNHHQHQHHYHHQHDHSDHRQHHEDHDEAVGDADEDGGGDEDSSHVNVRNEGTQTRDYAAVTAIGRSLMWRRKSGNQYFSLLYFAFHVSISVCLLRVNGQSSR